MPKREKLSGKTEKLFFDYGLVKDREGDGELL